MMQDFATVRSAAKLGFLVSSRKKPGTNKKSTNHGDLCFFVSASFFGINCSPNPLLMPHRCSECSGQSAQKVAGSVVGSGHEVHSE